MPKDKRKILQALKSELQFLQHDGYRRSPETAWRAKYIFEDSPTCANKHSGENPSPCADCALTYLVPLALRAAKFPCRHIPLNAQGETLDSLYRYSDQGEIESIVETWLRSAIARLEEDKAPAKPSTFASNNDA
jgi:hypothetical protein